MARLFNFWQWRPRQSEIERELRAHLDLETEDQRESGLPQEEAQYQARRSLGNATQISESMREVWTTPWLETLGQDFRYALRSLRASPVFALVAILSLGFGSSANTAIFSFVNALILKQLPVPEPNRLVGISEDKSGEMVNSVFSRPFIDALNKDNSVLDGVAGRFGIRVNVTGQGFNEPLSGEVVTGDYFRTLRGLLPHRPLEEPAVRSGPVGRTDGHLDHRRLSLGRLTRECSAGLASRPYPANGCAAL